MKIIEKEDDFKQEVNILKKLDHDHILKYHDDYYTNITAFCHFYGIITDYCEVLKWGNGFITHELILYHNSIYLNSHFYVISKYIRVRIIMFL